MKKQTNAHIIVRVPNESPQLLPALLRMLADDLEVGGGRQKYELGSAWLTLRIVQPKALFVGQAVPVLEEARGAGG